jgi:hypothetical protein
MPTKHPLELNRAVPGGRVAMFAIRDGDYPGGWFYRFQYYHPDERPILRYDNAHDDATLGWHHRHISFDEDTEIEFHTIVAHIVRFLQDLSAIIEGATTIEDTDDTDTHSTNTDHD